MDGGSFYQPLKGNRAIRLLHLEPGDPGDTIKCTLELSRLPEIWHARFNSPSNLLKYEAVSYVWGPPSVTREIVVDGWRRTVRENLWQFLRRARGRNETRILWIDALCINQSNVQERNAQVQMMGAIYRCAERVLVWLGIEDSMSSIAMTYLSSFSSSKAGIQSETPSILEASLFSWASRDYWTRTWVVQEFTLARKILVICGDQEVDWQALQQICQQIAQHTLPHRCSDLLLKLKDSDAFSLLLQRSSRNRTKISFLDILVSNRHRKAFDPRDKVYAMLSLATDLDLVQRIEVDYEKHPLRVLLDVLRHCRVMASDVFKQGQFLSNLLHIDDWDTIKPQPDLQSLHCDVLTLMTGRDINVIAFKTGEVVFAEQTHSHNDLPSLVLQIQRKAMIDLTGDEITSMAAQLYQLDQRALRIDPTVLNGLNQGLASRAVPTPDATSFPDCQSIFTFVAFTSLCRHKQFLLGISSRKIQTGDELVSFIGFKNALIVRSSPFNSSRLRVISKAVCVQAPGRNIEMAVADLAQPAPVTIFSLPNAGQCVDSRRHVPMKLTESEVLALLR